MHHLNFSNLLNVNLHDLLVVYNPYNITLYPFTELIIGLIIIYCLFLS